MKIEKLAQKNFSFLGRREIYLLGTLKWDIYCDKREEPSYEQFVEELSAIDDVSKDI